MRRPACCLLALLATLSVQAVEVRQFDDPAKQARYERLIEELRCLVCQNQSLADSDADLARDLRDEVYGIIQSGKDEQEAIRFLTDRYGDFVLYRPPVKPITWLLWIGPLLILLGGGLFLWRRHAHSRLAIDDGMTASEHQRLEQLKHELLHKDDP
jgi:cytochrome c-type biogenesis protein CcmH